MKMNDASASESLGDFLRDCVYIILFFVLAFLAASWASFVIGAIVLLISWYAYEYPTMELLFMGFAFFALGVLYVLQSKEIQRAKDLRKRSIWQSPFSDIVFLIFTVSSWFCIVVIYQDTRLFMPFLFQIGTHILGGFAKLFWYEPEFGEP